jgi:hypothetical protein
LASALGISTTAWRRPAELALEFTSRGALQQATAKLLRAPKSRVSVVARIAPKLTAVASWKIHRTAVWLMIIPMLSASTS